MIEQIRTIVVGGSPLLQSGIATALAQDPRLKVVDRLCAPANAVEPGRSLDCDVLVLISETPHADVTPIVERLAALSSTVKILALTASDSRDEMVDSFRAGIQGYGIYTDLQPTDLCEAVVVLARWGFWACPGTIRHLVDFVLHGGGASATRWAAGVPLSQREFEVLELAAKGATEDDIAETLCLSRNTVKTYLRRIREKLQAESRADAVSRAIERGIVFQTSPRIQLHPLAQTG